MEAPDIGPRQRAFEAWAAVLEARMLGAAKSSSSAGRGASRRSAQSDAIDALFADCAADGQPGAVVAVVQDGRTVHEACYGLADVESGQPLRADTLLHLGSTTKHICASAILLLEQKGLLRLDDSVRNHFPELSEVMAPITLRHLLNMTSGLPDGLNLPLFAGLPEGSAFPPARHFDILRRLDRLMFAPGAGHTYSNSNYLLLSMLVERIASMSLGAFLAQESFVPLGMNATQLMESSAPAPGKARGYCIGADGAAIQAPPMHHLCGDGGIVSTLSDMQLWLAHFANGRLGGELLRDRLAEDTSMPDGRRTHYGLGLATTTLCGAPKLSHAGGMPGFLSDFAYFPEQRLGIILLSNRMVPTLLERTDEIAKLFLPAAPDAPAAVSELSPLLGSYVSHDYGCTAEFAREDDEVVLYLRGERFHLRPSGQGCYQTTKPGMAHELHISPEQDGARPLIDMLLDGAAPARFRPFTAAADAPLAEYEGAYRSALLGETHQVRLENGALQVSLGSALRELLWRVLKPRGGNVFSAIIPGEPNDTDVTLVFRRDNAGRVTSFDYNLSRTRGLTFAREGE